MSQTFKSIMASDAGSAVLNGNEFAEDVVYTPAGGQSKTIKAIVERRRILPASEDSNRVLVGTLEITIARDAVLGILNISKGQNPDQVLVSQVIGGSGVNFFVADILSQDEGMWHLLLQK
jgi:hypothetical protein